MEFPQVVPSKRSVEAGDFPVKKYMSQNGAELRILYGDRRTGKKLTLQYDGITDAIAQQFYDHYHAMQGTFQTFGLSNGLGGAPKKGWEGNASTLGAGSPSTDHSWRYERPPVITNVYPGVSNVRVSLVSVLVV